MSKNIQAAFCLSPILWAVCLCMWWSNLNEGWVGCQPWVGFVLLGMLVMMFGLAIYIAGKTPWPES